MTMATAGSSLRSSRQTSNPDWSGSETSSSTTEGRVDGKAVSAASPDSASTTSKPSCSQAWRTSRRDDGSGSTISTFRVCPSAPALFPSFIDARIYSRPARLLTPPVKPGEHALEPAGGAPRRLSQVGQAGRERPQGQVPGAGELDQLAAEPRLELPEAVPGVRGSGPRR